jgi:ketosteroid isomerase-like protein
MELCHPEIEWIAPEDGATHRGRAGVRQRLEEWLESFDDCRWEVQRMIDFGGGEVLVEATEVGAAQRAVPRFARPSTSCSRSGTG